MVNVFLYFSITTKSRYKIEFCQYCANFAIQFVSFFPERFPVGLEKRTCQALCRLRNEGDEAKEVKDQ